MSYHNRADIPVMVIKL